MTSGDVENKGFQKGTVEMIIKPRVVLTHYETLYTFLLQYCKNDNQNQEWY